MHAAHGFPIRHVGQVDARAHDVLKGRARFLQNAGDDGQALVRLPGNVGIVAADRAGAGNHDVPADTHGAGEADDGLVRGSAGNVLAGVHCSNLLRSTYGYSSTHHGICIGEVLQSTGGQLVANHVFS